MKKQPKDLGHPTPQQAEEALRDSEERFRTMANAIPQLAWIARSDGYIFWYNQRWYDYTGTTPEEMEGWGWQSVHDPEMLLQVLEQWRASIATGRPFDMVFPLRGGDGEFRPFLTRVMPLKDAGGQVVQWFGTSTDITENQRAEEALRKSEASLAEAQRISHLGNWEWDINKNELTISEEIYRILDLPIQETFQTREDFLSFVHPDDLPVVNYQLEEAIRSGRYGPYDYRIVRRDGSICYIHARGQTHFDQKGRPLTMLGTVQDITERKLAEEALRQAYDELDQRVKERTEDLRHTVEVLQEEAIKRQRAEEALKESEAKLRDLARHLLSLQEEERQALSLDLQESIAQSIAVLKMDLRTFEQKLPARNKALLEEYRQTLKQIDGIVENLRRRAAKLSPQMLTDLGLTVGLKSLCESYDIECLFYLDDLSECFSLEDQFSIYRVFQEAMNNVSRHSQASLVTLFAKKQDDRVEFLVEDNGQGFEVGKMKDLEEERRSIGLAAMSERVRSLGGTFKIESQPGMGTRVFFNVPRTQK